MRALIFLLAVLPVVAFATPPSNEELEKFRASMEAKDSVDRDSLPGAAVYHSRCQMCHEGQAPKAPAKTFVQLMRPEAIYDALTSGIMQAQASGLSEEDRKHVAEYLSGEPFGAPQPPEAPACTGAAAKFDLNAPRSAGWGFGLTNNHFASGDIARLPASYVPRLKLKWAFAYPSALRARSRPSFAYGALYVGSQGGRVYALDAKTGCIRWTFQTNAEVRTPVVFETTKSDGAPLAFFGDLLGRAYAVEALTGKPVWRTKVDEHPSATITGSPVFYEGLLYVPVSSLEEASADPSYPCCTFRGSVMALDARTGKTLWKTYTIGEPPRETGVTSAGVKIFAPSGAAVWNTPTLDTKRGVLYVGTGNNYSGPANDRSNAIIAMDLHSGAIRWSQQIVPGDAWNVGCMIGNANCPSNPGPDFDIGSGTMLARLSGNSERILVGLKSGMVVSLDPDRREKPLWTNRVGRGSIQGGVQFGMSYDGKLLFVPIADMAQSNDASSKEREAAAGPARPGLYALDPNNGKLAWTSLPDNECKGEKFCDPGILASIASSPGVVYAGHLDGRVRAYDAATGKVLWQYDTRTPVKTLSGVIAAGGSIGGGGPVPYQGMLYSNSGYGLYFHLPGNVLMAFSVDGR